MDDANRTANIWHTQLETLVSYMEKYPDLAKTKKDNSTAKVRKVLWFDLYIQLNAVLGGTQKTLEQWKKVWTAQKLKTHTKALNLIETGGNSPYLTPLEERILKILSLNEEFKSPEPSSDIFLIPETGIVFLLPIVAQDGSQPSGSQNVSSVPSTSKGVPETPLALGEIRDHVLSESSNGSVAEGLPIKQETQEEKNLITKLVAECHTESARSSEAVSNPPGFSVETVKPAADFPSSTTSKVTSGKGCKRRRGHIRSHYMTADKAAETFGFISERNCAVLERIASAMEAQANRASRQTQLMREIVEIVTQK